MQTEIFQPVTEKSKSLVTAIAEAQKSLNNPDRVKELRPKLTEQEKELWPNCNLVKDITIGDNKCQYICTQPNKDCGGMSSCLINANGDGLFFSLNLNRADNVCFPIINKTILSDKGYSFDIMWGGSSERMVGTLFDYEETEDEEERNNERNAQLAALVDLCQPILEQCLPNQPLHREQQHTEFSHDQYKNYKISTNLTQGTFMPYGDIRITNNFGDGIILYSNGDVKPMINNQIQNHRLTQLTRQDFDTYLQSIQQKDPSVFDLLVKNFSKWSDLPEPKITTDENGYKKIQLADGYQISIRQETSGKKASIMVTNEYGEGICCYANDKFVNPVNKYQTQPKSGVDKGEKGPQYFDTLNNFIKDKRYAALRVLCNDLTRADIKKDFDFNKYIAQTTNMQQVHSQYSNIEQKDINRLITTDQEQLNQHNSQQKKKGCIII